MVDYLDIEKVFKFRDGVRFFNFDESSFVIDTSDYSLFNLGMSSALISASLDGRNKLSNIMDVIRKVYDASAADSEEAVTKFIAMMQQKNLIQEVS